MNSAPVAPLHEDAGPLPRTLQPRHVEMIAIGGDTRISLTVLEQSSGKEFRFVPEGPVLSRAEAAAVLDAASAVDCDYFVASGSLPRGIADDFYVEIGRKVTAR